MPLPDWLQGIHHDGSADFVSSPDPAFGQAVRLRLRVPSAAPLRRVWVRHAPDGEQAFEPMEAVAGRGTLRWYETELVCSQPRVHYRFALEASDGTWWYTAAGPSLSEPLDAFDFQLLADFQRPAWLEEAIFYQIFPDRFCRGDDGQAASGGRAGGSRPFDWGAPPDPATPFGQVFYGGDLAGVRQRLDHVQALGANALYLNPIFSAQSNHRYDVTDYRRVDPDLGGDRSLAELAAELRRRGMRYLLDIAPNHCGKRHPWFRRAQSDSQSPEAGFFQFEQHPGRYACWLGVEDLPKLDYQNPELCRRMFEADDSVFRCWLQPPFSADGWRVDVANMLGRLGAAQLGPRVNRAIRQAVKQTRADTYLLGEHWFDASGLLQGDQYDGVMNYAGFAHPLIFWLAGHDLAAWGMPRRIRSPVPWPTAALAATWRERLAVVPWAVARGQLNLLGSHDTPRIRTRLGGDEALARLAVAIQFCFPGVPCVYYGDEIGLAALRRDSPALKRGGFQVVAVGVDQLAFLRTLGSERVLLVAHRGRRPWAAPELDAVRAGLADGLELEQLWGPGRARVAGGRLVLADQPRGASVWRSLA